MLVKLENISYNRRLRLPFRAMNKLLDEPIILVASREIYEKPGFLALSAFARPPNISIMHLTASESDKPFSEYIWATQRREREIPKHTLVGAAVNAPPCQLPPSPCLGPDTGNE